MSTSASAPPSAPEQSGAFAWLKVLLAKLFGGSAASTDATPAGEKRLDSDDSDEQFIVAPGGYRIRVPQTQDMGHCVGEMLPSVRQALQTVPPLPLVVLELIKEVQDPNSTAAGVAKIAGTDPALAAALLRTVNSSAFALNRKVTSVAEAVSYLGFGLVKSMVVRLRLDQVLTPASDEAAVDAEDLWIHSLAVSYVADYLAERVPGVDRGFASTLGLLHDIGKMAINAQLRKQAKGDKRLPDEGRLSREARLFGVDHAGLGASLALRWQLPADLVKAIRWHHQPEMAFESTDPPALRKAVFIVQIANQLAKYGFAYADDMEIDAPSEESFAALGFSNSLDELMDHRVRDAIGRAVLFAMESEGPAVVRRFLRLRQGDEAAEVAVAASAESKPRVHVDPEILPAMFEEADSTEHYVGHGSQEGVSDLLGELSHRREKFEIAPGPRAAVCFLARTLLPNLIAPSIPPHNIEVIQRVEDGKLIFAVRCDLLGFARRLPEGNPSQRLALVDAELANLLNLSWFDSVRISEDGTMWRFAAV